MQHPVNSDFNAAVLHIANQLMPRGWNVADDAPSTPETIKASYDTGRPTVWSGASDKTSFADPEVNYAFRAWHDWAHYRHNLPLTLEGEIAAAYVQASHLVSLYGQTPQTQGFVALLFAEAIGMARYNEIIGAFPVDQAAFVAQTWRSHLPEARTFMLSMRRPFNPLRAGGQDAASAAYGDMLGGGGI